MSTNNTVRIILLIIGILFVASGIYSLLGNSSLEDKETSQTSNNEQSISLESQSLFNDKISIQIPSNFKKMSEEETAKVSVIPENTLVIYTNEDGTINILFTYASDELTEEDIPELEKEVINNLDQIHPSAKLLHNEIVKINEKTVDIIEIETPGENADIYLLMAFTDVDGKLFSIHISLPKDQMEEWQSIGYQIIYSLEVK